MATFTGTEAGEPIVGGVEDDLLEGLGGNDTLDGGEGIDRLEGGLGDDRYIVGETRREVDGSWEYWSDETIEAADAGIDTAVWMGLGGYRLADEIENGEAGTRFGGVLWGNALNNRLVGWTGSNDGNWLNGEDGDDTLIGGDGRDTLNGGTGSDTLVGYSGDVEVNPSLDDDTLDGGEGADVMIGGRGYDTYWADDLGDVIVEVAVPEGADDTGTYYYSYDTVYWTGAGTYELAQDVDILHLRGGSTAAVGNAQSNVLFSDYGGYTQLGEWIGEGDATLDGAGGDDLVFGGSGADRLLGGDGSDMLAGADGGDIADGGAGDDVVRGDAIAGDLAGEGGADVLAGGDGDDTLDGGLGDDTLDGGEGGDVLLGGAGDDTMTGGAGLDRFAGQAGADVLTDFADGEDLILGDFALATIAADGADTLITFAPESGSGTLRLLGIDAGLITADDFVRYTAGGELDDTLTGGGEENFIAGGDGNDAITVGAGDDGSDGGAGNDLLAGGRGADELRGGTGDDVLDGGTGADTMSGGAGDDRFLVTDARDRAVDTGGGLDTVEATVSVRLGRGIENLVLGEARQAGAALAAPRGLVGTGNALDNQITGSAGGDRLLGQGGDDRLGGGGGDDRLLGGGGADRLTGGKGADTFVLRDREGGDVIADFRDTQGDRIEIHAAQADSFADLTITEGRRGSAVISWQGGSVTLLGVGADTLDAGDFRFVAHAFAPEAFVATEHLIVGAFHADPFGPLLTLV